MRRTVLLVLLLVLFVKPVMADEKLEAEKMVRDTLAEVLDCLRANLSDEIKRERIIEIINPFFDFALMGKLALGKLHWPKLNEEERGEYTELFVKQLQDSYADQIALFANETLESVESVQVKTKVHVTTTILSNAERNKVLYKFYKSKEGWKVYDVEIQGVSIVSSYRAQYAEALKVGSVKELLKKMRANISTKSDDGK
jgi:phospholipid transport system substrate-binding protein